MQQLELISGFSELKELLKRTYKIDRERSSVKLYFSESNNELLMHDFDDHKKVVIVCYNIELKSIPNSMTRNARRLLAESLKQKSPSKFLIEEFQLNGFFRA